MRPHPPPGPPSSAPRIGLWRASAWLLAGGVLAQLLPLLLGPWLTRLYSPAAWGAFALFAAVAANLAVAACLRYDFALPLARDDDEASALLALCARIGLGVVGLTALGTAVALLAGWAPAWWALLPLAVAVLAALQAGALWASRGQRFAALAGSRVLQHGGAAVLQGLLALAAWALWAEAGSSSSSGADSDAGAGPPSAAWLVTGVVVAGLLALPPLIGQAPVGGWSVLWRLPRAACVAAARAHRDFPWLNTPHAFLGALQDAVAVALLVTFSGEAAAGWWALALRYLKAPATLVGGALSQALYPRLVAEEAGAGLRLLRRLVAGLAVAGTLLAAGIATLGPPVFRWAFGEDWAPAGELAQALALYIGAHFVASPLGVVTLAWRAQAWALRVAVAGQVLFVLTLSAGLAWGGPVQAAAAVSVVMTGFYAAYAAWLCSGRLRPPPRPTPSGLGGADGGHATAPASAALHRGFEHDNAT